MSVVFAISAAFAILAGLVHVFIFVLESVIWTSPRVRQVFRIESEAEAIATKGLAFNQGFYNLFLAVGAILGAVLVFAGATTVGFTLLVFACASMVGAAVVLAGTGRRYLNSSFVQGTTPFLALLFAFIGSLLPAAS